jgi:hypothetical protein
MNVPPYSKIHKEMSWQCQINLGQLHLIQIRFHLIFLENGMAMFLVELTANSNMLILIVLLLFLNLN